MAHLDSSLGSWDPQDPFRINALFLQERQQLGRTRHTDELGDDAQKTYLLCFMTNIKKWVKIIILHYACDAVTNLDELHVWTWWMDNWVLTDCRMRGMLVLALIFWSFSTSVARGTPKSKLSVRGGKRQWKKGETDRKHEGLSQMLVCQPVDLHYINTSVRTRRVLTTGSVGRLKLASCAIQSNS